MFSLTDFFPAIFPVFPVPWVPCRFIGELRSIHDDVPDDGSAVLVAHVGDDVQVGGPELKLTLPVNDGGQGRSHQERALGVSLGGDKGKGSVTTKHKTC